VETMTALRMEVAPAGLLAGVLARNAEPVQRPAPRPPAAFAHPPRLTQEPQARS